MQTRKCSGTINVDSSNTNLVRVSTMIQKQFCHRMINRFDQTGYPFSTTSVTNQCNGETIFAAFEDKCFRKCFMIILIYTANLF